MNMANDTKQHRLPLSRNLDRKQVFTVFSPPPTWGTVWGTLAQPLVPGLQRHHLQFHVHFPPLFSLSQASYAKCILIAYEFPSYCVGCWDSNNHTHTHTLCPYRSALSSISSRHSSQIPTVSMITYYWVPVRYLIIISFTWFVMVSCESGLPTQQDYKFLELTGHILHSCCVSLLTTNVPVTGSPTPPVNWLLQWAQFPCFVLFFMQAFEMQNALPRRKRRQKKTQYSLLITNSQPCI